jgi:tetratricopeptide (TPR) repeat protein
MWRLFGSRDDRSVSVASDEDIATLRRNIMELQDRILTMREKDILPLRENVSAFGTRLILLSAVSGVIIAVLTFFGVKQYGDLQQLIRDSFKQQLEKSFGYYDKLMRARVLYSDRKYKLAESYYRDLWDGRPEDEIVFYGLVDCLVQQSDTEGACQVVDAAEKAGSLPRKYQMLFSFNNAGFALLGRDIDQPSKLDKAFRYLKRAEEIGMRDNDPDLAYPLFNLALYYFATGDRTKAQAYAARWREVDNSPWQEPVDEPWYQRLIQAQPTAAAEMKEAFGRNSQPAGSPSPTASVASKSRVP